MEGLTGGCQCGAIRYQLASEPTDPSICHCRMCQKAFGNYVAPLAGVPMADLAWTRGEPGRFRSSEAVERGFCRDCGTPLFYRVVDRDRISVAIGSLDDPDRVVPANQHGIENRRPAFALLASLPEETTEAGTAPELLTGGGRGSIQTTIRTRCTLEADYSWLYNLRYDR